MLELLACGVLVLVGLAILPAALRGARETGVAKGARVALGCAVALLKLGVALAFIAAAIYAAWSFADSHTAELLAFKRKAEPVAFVVGGLGFIGIIAEIVERRRSRVPSATAPADVAPQSQPENTRDIEQPLAVHLSRTAEDEHEDLKVQR